MSALVRIGKLVWRRPVSTSLKLLSVLFGDGALLSARPDLEPLDLDRDFDDVDRLLKLEQWPFVRADVEISHAQPDAVGLVARKKGRFAGFYLAHHFGDVGYLDMSIIAPEFRGKGIGRPLHVAVVRALAARGKRSLVVHTTNESAPMIDVLGFDPGQTFTLLARPGDPSAAKAGEATPLDLEREAELVDLDARVFGVRRPTWIGGLLRQPTTRFYGEVRDGRLVASLCTRARRDGAVCLDGASALDFADLAALTRRVCALHAADRIECFARGGGHLAALLRGMDFTVPGFFEAIGPLVEWRKGVTGPVGRTPHTESLSWF